MKNYIITLLITTLFTLGLNSTINAQINQYLLVTVENSFSVQSLNDNDEFNNLKTLFDIYSVEQAFSNSRKEELRQVFTFRCNCDYIELAQKIERNYSTLKTPEVVYETELLTDIPNDYNLTFASDYSLELIQAKEAWGITTGNPEVIIGISDSNYDLSHGELGEEVAYVQQNLTNPNMTHGTAVATSASGATNNAEGKSSIGYNTKLSLHDMSYNGVLNAKNNGAKVINLSWASSCYHISYHQQVIDEVLEAGAIVVAAAGNGGTCGGPSNLVYPAAYDGVISVSSIGPNYNHEQITGNLNSTHQHNEKVDICAPGYSIPVAFPNNQYTTSSGTSFAAPLVTGTIGLMLSVNPRINHCEADYILKQNALNIDSLNEPYQGLLGAGALNAYKSVQHAVDFETTEIYGTVVPLADKPLGSLNIIVESELPIDHYNHEIISTYTDSTGREINTYDVFITYQNGCVFKSSFIDDQVDFFDDSIIVLPVEGLEIAAEIVEENALVSWSTESENNNSHFELYKSFDGITWELINSEEGVGNSNTVSSYSYRDNGMLKSLQYYRLVQYDFNGNSFQSDIVSLVYEIKNEISMHPNPCTISTQIISQNEIKQINLIDGFGKILESIVVNNTEYQIQTAQLKEGLYTVLIQFENGEYDSQKLIVR